MLVGSGIEGIVDEMYIEVVTHRSIVGRQVSSPRVGEGVNWIPIA
jgi:hypothetical protein